MSTEIVCNKNIVANEAKKNFLIYICATLQLVATANVVCERIASAIYLQSQPIADLKKCYGASEQPFLSVAMSIDVDGEIHAFNIVFAFSAEKLHGTSYAAMTFDSVRANNLRKFVDGTITFRSRALASDQFVQHRCESQTKTEINGRKRLKKLKSK